MIQNRKKLIKVALPLEAILKAAPAVSRSTAKRLLDELRAEDEVHSRGEKRQARWFPGAGRFTLARRVRS